MKRLTLLLLLGAASCPEPPPPPAGPVLRVRVGPTAGLSLESLAVTPAEAVLARHSRTFSELDLVLSADAGLVRLEADDACPLEVTPGAEGEVTEVTLVPFLTLGPDRPQLGFDTDFTLELTPGCRDALAGRVEWEVVEGRELVAMESTDNGYRLHARTPSLSALRPGPLPPSVVPFSPASRGESVVEARWRHRERTEVRRLRIAPVAPTTGFPAVPVGQRVVLGGAWQIAAAPAGSTARTEAAEGATYLVPDRPGRWHLTDGAGRRLIVSARRHDQVRLDCGRPECHPSVVASTAASPMTTSLSRLLSGELEAEDPACTLGCHVTGLPGLADGGLWHLGVELGVDPTSTRGADALDRLPRAMQRVASVGCSACHGPGSLPDPSGWWPILSSEVCASCHDAPPRYSTVQQWRDSSMSHADADDAARETPSCRRCHTTDGFLDLLGRRRFSAGRRPPLAEQPLGIACAACHSAHADDAQPHLLRRAPVGVPEAVDAATRLCVTCHLSTEEEPFPTSTAANLWAGRGGLDEQGAALIGPAPHASVEGGCLGCHTGESGHRFEVDRTRCRTCHEKTPEPDPGLRTRARMVWRRLVRAGLVEPDTRDRPAHARGDRPPPTSDETRALHDVLLVLGDDGAGVHNPAYARRVLDVANRLTRSRRDD